MPAGFFRPAWARAVSGRTAYATKDAAGSMQPCPHRAPATMTHHATRLPRVALLTLVAAGATWVTAAAQDRVRLPQRIEITQGIQDPLGRVPLIAGRDTWARTYLELTAPGPLQVRGRFRVVAGDGRVLAYESLPATLTPGLDGAIRSDRGDFASTINLYLPPEATVPGTAFITLVDVLDIAGSIIPCENCNTPQPVPFGPPVTLRLKVIGFQFEHGGRPRGPSALDFERLESWLRRTYPVSNVEVERAMMNPPGDFYYRPRQLTCDVLNRAIDKIRVLDLKAGQDPRVHYYGMVGDIPRRQWAMQGCSTGVPALPDPTVVASGPAGRPSDWPQRMRWDRDGSYADWYGAHEIAHTLGRAHPGRCGQSNSDPDFPYARARIGDDSTDNQGFDPEGKPPLLSRHLWRDVMSYCPRQWVSAYTYNGILARLRAEDSLFVAGELQVAQPQLDTVPSLATDSLLYLLVKFNMAENTGDLQWVFTVPVRSRPPLTDSAMVQQVRPDRVIQLEITDSAGTLVHASRSWIRTDEVERYPESDAEDEDGDTSTVEGAARTGTVAAYLPNRGEPVVIRVLRNGVVLDSVRVTAHAPELGVVVDSCGKLVGNTNADPDSLRFEWTATDPDGRGERITFYVQFQSDGSRWSTIAQTADPVFNLPLTFVVGRSHARLRVLASDGVNDAKLFDSCELVRPDTQPPPLATTRGPPP